MSKHLLRWFGDRQMETVLSLVEKHLELSQAAASGLTRMVEAASSGRQADKDAFYEGISDAERKADVLRREVTIELTRRDAFPNEREDLMELVRAVDWITDWAREAGRILSVIPFEKAPQPLKTSTEEMCRGVEKCVSVLADCIHVLQADHSKALDLADQVERLEEGVDDLYTVVRGYEAKLDFPGFSTGALVLLNSFLDAIEMVADWCENTADLVRVIAVRLH